MKITWKILNPKLGRQCAQNSHTYLLQEVGLTMSQLESIKQQTETKVKCWNKGAIRKAGAR